MTATEHLSAAYAAWLDAQNLDRADALELLMGAKLTGDERQWLTAFCTVWDGVQAMEDAAAAAQPPADAATRFVVMCFRSASSIFGAQTAPLKLNGEVMRFPTREAAQVEADRLSAALRSRNVSYRVEREA